MTETEAVAKAIYESRNGHGCTPWSRLPGAHKGPYLADAMAAIRVILETQYPGRAGQYPPEKQKAAASPTKGPAASD